MILSPHLGCTISIAGLTVSIECEDAALLDRLRMIYRVFLVDADPHLTVSVRPGRQQSALIERPIAFESGVLHFGTTGDGGFIDLAQRRGELAPSTAQPLTDVDYFLRTAFALLAFQASGLMFHAAGIAHQGRGYAFFGHSGSGKTTIARLSSNDVVLNDDLVLLMPRQTSEVSQDFGGLWAIHATPFSNATQFKPSGPRQIPLAKMLRLVQNSRVYLEEMPSGQAVAEVITSVPIVPLDPMRDVELLDRAYRLVQSVPVHRLHFLPDDSFWRLLDQSSGLHRV